MWRSRSFRGSRSMILKRGRFNQTAASSELTSKPFEKVIFKNRNTKFLAETFTFPNVMVGTIIEYRFRLKSSWTYINEWILDHDLFTVKEHFLFKHAGPFVMSFVVNGSAVKPEKRGETYELEL